VDGKLEEIDDRPLVGQASVRAEDQPKPRVHLLRPGGPVDGVGNPVAAAAAGDAVRSAEEI
jgi:hypothetical protein